MSDQIKKREKALEEGYFKKEEAKALAAIAEKKGARKCPVCVEALNVILHDEVEIDVCDKCGGIWLDKGELEKIIANKKEQDTHWFELLTEKLRW